MKRILTITAFFLAFGMMVQAQNTLEYSQAKIVTAEETVPAGKVWKVVSVFSSTNMVPLGGTTSASSAVYDKLSTEKSILIGGNEVFISGRRVTYAAYSLYSNGHGKSASESFGQYTEMPLWVPSGTTLAQGANCNGISVIEFNVAP